jgi:hypothetical protein
MEITMEITQKLKIELPFDPAISQRNQSQHTLATPATPSTSQYYSQ